MQHFRVKIFATAAEGVDIAQAIPVFHRWIQQSALPEMLIDVADYGHVPAGPGVLLVGHDSHYSLDLNKNRLGLLYSRRTVADGSAADRIADAIDRAAAAAARIAAEAEFAGRLQFDSNEMEISVNDRYLAPNTPAAAAALEPDLRAVLDARWGPGAYTLELGGEPRELLTFRARKRFGP